VRGDGPPSSRIGRLKQWQAVGLTWPATTTMAMVSKNISAAYRDGNELGLG
jgi:hypothetical protein